MKKMINGILVDEFKRGWWGSNNNDAGADTAALLEELELPIDKIPFSVEEYLSTGKFTLNLHDGKMIEVTLEKQDSYYEFICKCSGHKHGFKLHREWDGVNIDTIIKLESYAIGEMTLQLLLNKKIL